METNINIWVVLSILAIHWLADFVFQTDKMATGKSKNWFDLWTHTFTYSLVFLFVGLFFMSIPKIIFFCSITFVFHTIQDYFTSRINSKLWEQKKVHWFFVSIGFDQLLHFIQLILTYQLLK